MLVPLKSQGVSEACSTLEGNEKQSQGVYQIGNTVQPVVNVNLGVRKVISGSVVSDGYILDIPAGKVWKFICGHIRCLANGVAGTRTIYIQKYIDGNSTYFCRIGASSTFTAGNTGYLYLNQSIYTGTTLASTFNIAENQFFGSDDFVISISAGDVGDTITWWLEVLEFDVV